MPERLPGRLVVVYGRGAAGPTEIIDAATNLVDLAFVVDSTDPHSARIAELLADVGETFDLAALPVTAVAERLRPDARGIVTFSETMLPATASLAALLGLPFHDEQTVRRLTDKYAQRAALAAHGVSPIRYATAATARVAAVLADIGLPAVVKPRIGQSSANTFRIDTPADIAVWSASSPGPSDEWIVEEQLLPGRHPTGDWLGDYCSVESAVSGDDIWHLAVTDKLPLAPPFRETGDVLPSVLPARWAADVQALAASAIRAMGIRSGLVHTEIKLTPIGPRVIEVNGRLAGDIGRLMRRGSDTDPVRLALELAIGLPVQRRPATFRHAVMHYAVVPPMRAVTVRELAPLATFRALPGVWSVDRRARVGATLDWRRGTQDLVFMVFAEAATAHDVPGVLKTLNAAASGCVGYAPA
jgi:hypothetical protein